MSKPEFKIPDEMLYAIAQLMYERTGPKGGVFPSAFANGYAKSVREKYLNGAHSVLLLAAEYWASVQSVKDLRDMAASIKVNAALEPEAKP